MSSPVDLKNPGRTLHAGIILMHGITEVLDLAPIDLLASLSKEVVADFPDNVVNDELRAQAIDIEFHWVNETGQSAQLSSNLTIQPTDSFATCPPLDIALIGANGFAYTPTDAELDFVRKTHKDCAAFLNICGGIIPCLAAGLLNGKSATAPLPMIEQLRATVTDTEWVEKRWHRDGKIWTSGTLLNGLDLMRAFVEEAWGGPGTLAEMSLAVGGWPVRENKY